VYDALCGAQRFILITGWSVWVETLLKRRPSSAECSPKLGELLLQRAEAGVKVGARFAQRRQAGRRRSLSRPLRL
jgi:hypothetical protein